VSIQPDLDFETVSNNAERETATT